MLIKDENLNNHFLKRAIQSILKRRVILWLPISLFFTAYSFSLFYAGSWAHKYGYMHVLRLIVQNNVRVPINYLKSFTVQPERLVINISFTNLQKLAYKREVALQRNLLITSPEDFVPATIDYKERTVRVRIRLKGDFVDQLIGDKWPIRVKVRGEETLLGMKEFSLHHPQTRHYIHEWIFHQALKREGLLSIRYMFVNLTLNGKDYGVYALEEHFDKVLIEYNRYREGPIIKFSEDLLWRERAHYSSNSQYLGISEPGAVTVSDIDAFQSNKMAEDSLLTAEYKLARSLLEKFRRGDLKTSEIFDVRKFAIYYALSDLLGAQHGTVWHNERFYFNPISSKLEPIGFDGNAGFELLAPLISLSDQHYNSMFSDLAFQEAYLHNLARLSELSYLDSLFLELEPELERNLRLIYSQSPWAPSSMDVYYKNQDLIRKFLNPVKALHAFYSGHSSDKVIIEMGNLLQIPVEVKNLSLNGLVIYPDDVTVLERKPVQGNIDYHDVGFTLPNDLVWSDTMITNLSVNYGILGTDVTGSENILPLTHMDESLVEDYISRKAHNFRGFDFLLIDENKDAIYLKPGHWILEKDLTIPKGYTVYAGAGFELILNNSAMFVSESPLRFIGSEESPVVIRSGDSTGQGMVVLNAQEESVLKYVHFINLSNPARSSWELTGAVTFYESPVIIDNCLFDSNRSEDGLNIIRTEFSINRTLFLNAQSDAFDADFTTGKISNSSYINSVNDAVDISGSTIVISDILIDGAGDKGISVGEASSLTVTRAEIKNADIALASKDMSDVRIDGIEISGGSVGLAVYQKKPEFGPASIILTGGKITGTDVPYLVELRSTLLINGKAVESNGENIYTMLYVVENDSSSY